MPQTIRGPKASPKALMGVTVAELLITISLIGLLMALILPSLNAAKDTAQTAVCISNLKQLHTGWYAYTTDHQNQLVPSETDLENTWVLAGNRHEAIENGLLYEYAGSLGTYRCPADYTNHTRSYSINNYLAGAFIRRLVATRHDDIKNPSDTLVMLEENDNRPSYSYNPGSWLNVPTGNQWLDRPGIFHPKATAMVFADGSAQTKIWEDTRTLRFSTQVGYTPNNNDLRWTQKRLAAK